MDTTGTIKPINWGTPREYHTLVRRALDRDNVKCPKCQHALTCHNHGGCRGIRKKVEFRDSDGFLRITEQTEFCNHKCTLTDDEVEVNFTERANNELPVNGVKYEYFVVCER